jgi:pseudouridine synthase
LDLIQTSARLFPVGRLDYESEGLVFLTNDGEMAHRLTHPRFKHWRTYLVVVEGEPTPDQIERLRQGVELEDGVTAPARVKLLTKTPSDLEWLSLGLGPGQSLLEVRIHEGRTRQVRRMMEAMGLPVLRLVRLGIGTLKLGRLPAGKSRPLRPGEVRALLSATGISTIQPAGARRGRRPTRHNRRTRR